MTRAWRRKSSGILEPGAAAPGEGLISFARTLVAADITPLIICPGPRPVSPSCSALRAGSPRSQHSRLPQKIALSRTHLRHSHPSGRACSPQRVPPPDRDRSLGRSTHDCHRRLHFPGHIFAFPPLRQGVQSPARPALGPRPVPRSQHPRLPPKIALSRTHLRHSHPARQDAVPGA